MGLSHLINLGRVYGLSAKEVIELADGLPLGSLTTEEFKERIRGEKGDKGDKGDTPTTEDILAAVNTLAVDDVPTEGSENMILSGGVHNGLYEGVGAIDDIVEGSVRYPTSGAVWRAVNKVAGHAVPTEITEPTPKPAVPNTKASYTTKISANTLTVILPAEASEGDSYSVYCCSIGDSSSTVAMNVDIEEGGILLMNQDVPTDKYALTAECRYSHGMWHCWVVGYSASKGVSGPPFLATVVYSGANRVSTAEESYTETANKATYTLSTNYFQTLCGKATIAGWTTKIDGTTAEYDNGSEVTLEDGQTLTLYPVYAPYVLTLNKQLFSGLTASGNDAYTDKAFTVSPQVSGLGADKVSVSLSVSAYFANAETGYVKVLKSGAQVGILNWSGKGTHSGTINLASVENGSVLTIRFGGKSAMSSCTATVVSYTIK